MNITDWKDEEGLGDYLPGTTPTNSWTGNLNVYDICKLITDTSNVRDLICVNVSGTNGSPGYTPVSYNSGNQYDRCITKIIKYGTIHPNGDTINTPPLVNLELKKHQQRTLYEMIAREDHPFRLISSKNLLFLCDNVGSGKTLSILSLIAQRPLVKSVWSNKYYLPKKTLSKYEAQNYVMKGVNVSNDIVVFKSNLLIIPHNIYNQWVTYIIEHTTLKCYSIGTKKQANLTKTLYDTVLNENHIICIKSTMVKDFVRNLDKIYGEVCDSTSSTTHSPNVNLGGTSFTGEEISNKLKLASLEFKDHFNSNPSKDVFDKLINTITTLREEIDFEYLKANSDIVNCDSFVTIEKPPMASKNGYMFQRVIIDEADSIHIPGFPTIHGKYTWLVTSSINNLLYPFKKSKWSNTQNCYHTLSNGIRGTGLIKDSLLHAVDYSGGAHYYKGYNSCRIFKAIVRNNRKFLKESIYVPDPITHYHKCFTPPGLLAITNAISKDALKALNAGDTKTAVALLGCDVGTEDDILKIVTDKLCSDLDKMKLKIKEKQEFMSETMGCLEQLNLLISDAKEMADAELLEDLVEQKKVTYNAQVSYKSSIQTCSTHITSIETKIRGMEERIGGCDDKICPICASPVKDPALTPCCKNVFCLSCIGMALQYSKEKECPLCRGKDLDIKKLNLIVAPTTNIVSGQTTGVLPSKVETILKLLNDRPDYRVMIFSEYTESFTTIATKLKELDIKYGIMSGSSNRITNIVNKFKNKEYRVMLLNANCFGAGMNLQFTDEVYIYHRMSADLETQVIGRAQRLGRSTPLNIHYMCYENEYPEKKGVKTDDTVVNDIIDTAAPAIPGV